MRSPTPFFITVTCIIRQTSYNFNIVNYIIIKLTKIRDKTYILEPFNGSTQGNAAGAPPPFGCFPFLGPYRSAINVVMK